jgi:lipopolysaccharide cholinephosphotransferase
LQLINKGIQARSKLIKSNSYYISGGKAMSTLPNEIDITPKQLRQMQLIQLEMLIELDGLCRENSINYSLDGGTLLGAIRHKGFIPWDDDIDIIMARSEYERFFEVCKNSLDSSRFFLQDYRTDPFYRVGYARMRRKGTVYHRAGHEHMKYQSGVFIDIFILDNVPNSILEKKVHRFLCYCLRRLLWSESGKVLYPKYIGRKWYQLLSLFPKDIIFTLLSKLADYYNAKETDLVRHMTHPYPYRCRYGIKRQYIEELVEVDFEGYQFFATKFYDEYLSDLYGDYMKMPPIEQRTVHIHLTKFVPIEPKLGNAKLTEDYFS